jgi:hypothetical protein
MERAIPPRVQQAVAALHGAPAVCTPPLRRAISAYASGLSLGMTDLPQLPPELAAYVTKVTRSAYQVTDADFQALEAAGYSGDAIFEITLCASIGAGMARFEGGLAALKGAD